VLDSYDEGDVVQGRVTKVVTFGAFVEILPGVEGLVHISELAQHHVENPREVVSQGDAVNVKIIEVDADRRRLSLSLKRVEEGEEVQPLPGGAVLPSRPQIDLSEEVFAEGGSAEPTPAADEPLAEAADASLEERVPDAEAGSEPEAEAQPQAEAQPAELDEAESPADLPTLEETHGIDPVGEDAAPEVPDAGETPSQQAEAGEQE
jgi:small subunit ribosomal protein S1